MKEKKKRPAGVDIHRHAGWYRRRSHFLRSPVSAIFTTEWIKPIGTIYVNLLKFLVVPVVLFSITDGVISLKDLKRVRLRRRQDVCVLYVHDCAGRRHRPRARQPLQGQLRPAAVRRSGRSGMEAKEAPSVMQVIVNIFPSNLLQPMVSSDMLPVIVIAIFLGAGVLASGEKGQKIAELINCMEEVIMKITMMIIKFTPIGVFCLMTNVVAVNDCGHHRQAGAHHRCCLYRLHRPCCRGLRPVRQVPRQDGPFAFLRALPGHDHCLHPTVLQRNAPRQHRVLQRDGCRA